MEEILRNLAVRIDPRSGVGDVVLPAQIRQQLTKLVEYVRSPPEELTQVRSVTALFHGVSGTAKSMAALAIARELDKQALRIDLSRLVSKYIGETEKQIDAVFQDATGSGAVLLFDEADALFGKRSEVRDSSDRYANVEVAYLLQRIEAYEGLAILTTNRRQDLDEAFLRRLRFVVEFPSRS